MKGKLVGYVCIGTNDLEVAKGFYDNLLALEVIFIKLKVEHLHLV